MQLSIIIPIYKVEKYLKKCVESVLNQTFVDYEILLVDDGSPDLCPKICDELASLYKRVVVFHKTNGGLSDARNYGLKHAKGEYVIFLDSDDYYLHNDFLEVVMKATQNRSKDAVFFQRTIFFEGHENSYKHLPLYKDEWMSLNGGDLLYTLSCHDRLDASACMKITKRSILLKNSLFFTKGIYSEDIEWFSRYILYVNDIAIVNKPDYCYRKRMGSITSSLTEKNVSDLFFSIETHSEAIRDSLIEKKKKEALLNYLSYQYYIILGLISYISMPIGIKIKFLKKCKAYKWLIDYSVSKKTRKSSKLVKIIGVNMTSVILGLYIKYKRFF